MSNLQIITFKRSPKKGSLVGMMNIFIPSVGMEIRQVTMWQKEGRTWFNFPSQKFTTENGETAYNPYVKIQDKNYYTAFQTAMRKAFDEYLKNHPEIANEEPNSYDDAASVGWWAE